MPAMTAMATNGCRLSLNSNIAHQMLLLFIISICGSSHVLGEAHPQLNYYELMHISHFSHNIVKRSAIYTNYDINNSIREVKFRAMNRSFNLLLQTNDKLFSPQFKAYTIDGNGIKRKLSVDFNEFYSGRVVDLDNSHVSAHIESNGVMSASIRTADDIYIIEPSWRHVNSLNISRNESVIIYKASDIKHSRNSNAAANNSENVHYCDYIKMDENATNIDNETSEHTRTKRQYETNSDFEPIGTHCAVYLVADYHFFRVMGGNDNRKTINYLIHIIDRVNNIFNNTEWKDEDEQRGFSGMGFWIKEILIHTEPTPAFNHYNSDVGKWNVRKLLEAFSHNIENMQFCLSHLFTHRKFDQSVLGLAYVASPRLSSVGGICSPSYRKESEGISLYLNTGLTTTMNALDQPIITREAVLVTTHEFGHNWGSEHDPDTLECSPSTKEGGSYIMHTYSVSGYDDNNKIFSPCSKRSIIAVLHQKSHRCFSKPDGAYCGNHRVEEGEECDEGLLAKDSDSNYKVGICCDSNCKLLPGSYCDMNSACCGRNCQRLAAGTPCLDSDTNNCLQESFCNGETDRCPDPKPQPDGINCLDKGKCSNGTCRSYCESIGLRPCMCSKLSDACFRCCAASDGVCFAIQFYDQTRDQLRDGTPCVHGFCDRGRCKKVVQDFVERLWDVIEDIDINSFYTIMKDNIVGVVIVVSLIIWIPASCLVSYYDKRYRVEQRRRSTARSVSNISDRSGLRSNRRRFSTRRSRVSSDNINDWIAKQRNPSTSVYYPPTFNR